MENDTYKIEKLTSASQWLLWKFQVRIMLSASDAFQVVSGDLAQPAEGDAKLSAWQKVDMKAQRVIATSVGQQALLHIVNCTTSNQMWRKLHTVYEQKSDCSVHLLQQRFYSFVKDPNDSIACHISKLEELVQQLKDLKENISDSMIMTKILMTLPASYNHFHSAWESTSAEQRTLDHLRERLMIEESRMSQKEWSGDVGEALMVKKQEGSNANVRNKKARKPGKCFHCGKIGHWKADCHKLKLRGTKKEAEDSEALMCEVFSPSDSKIIGILTLEPVIICPTKPSGSSSTVNSAHQQQYVLVMANQ